MKLPIDTKEGRFTAHYSERGLAHIDFPEAASSGNRSEGADASPAQTQRWHELTTVALKEVLAGKTPGDLPPLDLAGGTEFQRLVWSALREIPTGSTKSYFEVAAAIGKPGATRAVGGACGANPIPVLIPCHRVLAANRRLGGFSGGLDWKRRLLACEGIVLARD